MRAQRFIGEIDCVDRFVGLSARVCVFALALAMSGHPIIIIYFQFRIEQVIA